MFTGAQRLHPVGKVVVMRRGDIDRIQIAQAQQIFCLGKCMGNIPALSEGAHLFGAAATNGYQLLIAVLLQRVGKMVGNPAGTDNAPAQGRDRFALRQTRNG